jgi:DNA-directed RNA polymerase specialized sigma24 family protein
MSRRRSGNRRGVVLKDRNRTKSTFRHLLADLDPKWSGRSPEEQNSWVDWYHRTAWAISRQFARSFRDPSHDAYDVYQDILLKLLTKFRGEDAPHRLLTERPCIRNLMQWKALDRVDWESAARRNARLRCPLPTEEFALPFRRGLAPDQYVELREAERSFGSSLPDPERQKAYELFRAGRQPREVARRLGRKLREVKALHEQLADEMRSALVAT